MLIEDDGRVVQFKSVMCVYIYSGGWVLKERWWQFPLSKLVCYGLATRGCMIRWNRKRVFAFGKVLFKIQYLKRVEFQNLTFQFPLSIYCGFVQTTPNSIWRLWDWAYITEFNLICNWFSKNKIVWASLTLGLHWTGFKDLFIYLNLIQASWPFSLKSFKIPLGWKMKKIK